MSVGHYNSGCLLALDISHRVLHTNSVLDEMYYMHSRNNQYFKENCLKQFIGQSVITR